MTSPVPATEPTVTTQNPDPNVGQISTSTAIDQNPISSASSSPLKTPPVSTQKYPPLSCLPVSDDVLLDLDRLKKRKTVQVTYKDSLYTVQTSKDLYYEKMLLTLSNGLKDLTEYRKEKEKSHTHSGVSSNTNRTSVSSSQSLSPDPKARQSSASIDSLSESRESLTLSISEKPSKVVIEGQRVDLVSISSFASFFNQKGEFIIEALEKLAMLLIFLQNQNNAYTRSQESALSKQIRAIQKELAALEQIDKKEGTSYVAEARKALGSEICDLVDGKSIANARADFYKRPEVAESLKADTACALSQLNADEIKLLQNVMSATDKPKIKSIDPDKMDYKDLSFTSAEIQEMRLLLSKNPDPLANSISAKLVSPRGHAQIEVRTNFDKNTLDSVVQAHDGYVKVNPQEKRLMAALQSCMNGACSLFYNTATVTQTSKKKRD